MKEYIEIGFIVNTHGVRGHVKVKPLTDFPERFKNMDKLLVEDTKSSLMEYMIEDVKYHKGLVIIKIKDIDDMDSAQRLKGSRIVIDRKDAVELPENTYYIFDLMGCKVYEDNEFLGDVKDIIETGSNDVYIVDNDGKQLLIPALAWVVISVDIGNKRIQVKLPEGLRDI